MIARASHLLLGALLPIAALIVASCSSAPTTQELIKRTRQQQQDAINSMPAHLRAPADPNKDFPTSSASPSAYGDAFAPSATAVSSDSGIPASIPDIPDEELVWTDPDNPDENLGTVEQAFTKPVKDDWQLSYNAAQRLAYAEGKPLLIWFTNSRMSPICKRLDTEVLSTHEFKNWSEDHVVKLRVDLSPNEPSRKLRDKKVKYAQALRKKFGISGNPTMLVLDLHGQAFGRYRGYSKGEGAYYLGRLKQAAQTVNEDYFQWYPKMKQRGYRKWKGRNGVELFAKLLRYEEGRLQVVEPNGRKTIITESNLSAKDRAWIAQQKQR